MVVLIRLGRNGRTAARFAIVCLAASALHALQPDRLISQYHKQIWQVEDGLPHNYVSALLEDRSGFLLVGTDEGMARFDGLHFLPFQADSRLRIAQRWISALRRDESTQTLWIGTFDGSLITIRNGKATAAFGSMGSVFDLLPDGAGGVWASTRTGVIHSDGTAVSRVPGLARPPDTGWNVLARAPEGGVLVVTSNGLLRVQDSRTLPLIDETSAAGQILTVMSEADGTVWVGTTRGLFRLQRAADAPRLIPQAGVPGPVVAILRDRDHTLWAGTWGKGLYRITSQATEGWSSGRGQPDDFVRTLFEDREGDLWIGSRGGLTRWKDAALVPLGVPEGLTGDFATTVNEDPHGDLWLGTWRGGLYRLHGGRLLPQPSPVPTLFFTVRALTFDSRGNTWIGNWEGLYRFDGRRYEHFGGEADSPYQHVSAVLFDRRGALWIGTSGNGLFRFAGGAPGAAPESFLAGAEVSSLVEDREGRLWIGTNQGVGWLDPAGKFTAASGLPEDSIQSVSLDSAGRVWACTLGGMLYLISPRATAFDKSFGLPGYALYRLVDDGAGSLWISSARGVLQIPSTQVGEILDGHRRRFDVTVYGQEDGMRTIECHGLSQPAGNRANDGSIWFGTAKGFVQIPPGQRRTAGPPTVEVEQVSADGRVLRDASLLQAGARNVEVQYTALNLSAPGKIQFRYRMEGFDPDWVEANSDRTAHYNRLPAGEFTFLVAARNPGGAWSEPATLTVRQLPQFYQTWWFALMAACAAAGLVAMAYRRRTQMLRARYEAVLSERNRIAREWHDTLVAGFSAISLQLEAIRSRVKQQPDRAEDLIELTRRMVHHYRAEARRVIWDLRDSRPDSETLPEAVSNALHQVTDGRDVEGSVQVVGEPVRAPRELEHNVLRICQEALNNAIRHGEPHTLRLELEYTPAWLLVRVQDDGKGFEPERMNGLTGHFGLTVMRERAGRFGGTVRLESHPGDGTIVEARVPLQPAEKV